MAGVVFLAGIVVGAAVAPAVQRHASSEPKIENRSWPEASVAPRHHPAEVLRVLDGDSFEARVHIWPGLDVTTRVRLRGIDAPEIKAHCGEEHAKAQAAREALNALLTQGGVQVGNIGQDKQAGRIVADVSTRTNADVARALLDAGVVRPYAAGHRDSWC